MHEAKDCRDSTMIELGRLCVKIAGRDAGAKCIVVDNVDKKTVMIDGETRRRKCNIAHLEPLKELIKIKKAASHADISAEFKKLGLKARETKPKKAAARPTKVRKQKEELAEVVKAKKEVKKETKKEEKVSKKQ